MPSAVQQETDEEKDRRERAGWGQSLELIPIVLMLFKDGKLYLIA